MVVSGDQQRDLVIYLHVSILPQTPLQSRLPHNIEESYLSYTVGPFWLSILDIALCMCGSKLPNYPFSQSFPAGNRKFIL